MPVLTLAFHEPDPDAVPATSSAALDYIETVERMGAAGPKPTLQLGYGPDRGQRLDVYAPANARHLPILLFFHGGAWINGHLGWLRFMAEPVLANGAILVAGTYRLAPRCRWPAQLADAAAAVRYVAAHAHAWGGDPTRLAIGGHSAGGQLAAMALLCGDIPKVIAGFPVSAPFSLEHGAVPSDSDAGRVYKYLLADRSQDREASPLRFASRASVPMHLLWGARDIDYVSRSNAQMVSQLRNHDCPVTHEILADSSHFDTHIALGRADAPWYAQLRGAFERQGG